MKRWIGWALLSAVVLLPAAGARAADADLSIDAGDAAAGAAAPAGRDFAKGTWTLELGGSYVDAIRFSENTFYEGHVGVGYYLVDDLSLSAILHGDYVEQPADDAALGAAGLQLRWHFLDRGRFSLFLDAGGDVSYADPEVPAFGTHFNWIGRVGGGATWRLDDNFYLIGGARYFHLSNGNLHGRDQNPSYDGVQYWAGLMFTF